MSSCSVSRPPCCFGARAAPRACSARAPASGRTAASVLIGASSPARELQRRQAHWRIYSTQQPQQQSGDGWRPDPGLFKRAAELEWLEEEVCAKQPSAIQVLVGPRSCGKTAVLQEFHSRNPKAVYIDCRGLDTSSPAHLLAQLLTLVAQRVPGSDLQRLGKRLSEALLSQTKAAASMSDGVKFQLSIDNLRVALKSLLAGPERDATADIVFQEIRALVKDLQPKDETDVWPVIIVDEVNELMVWREDHPMDVRNLLSFLVLMSKQAQQCHVVLATSEYGFMDWLSEAIGSRFWEAAVIGDFTEGHAREFLHWRLRKRGETGTLDDAAWARVYEVCGGNAGDLVRLSGKLKFPINATNLDEALEAVSGEELDRISKLAKGGKGWTRAQFAAAALRLLDSPHNVVPTEDMEALLGQYEGKASRDTDSQLLAGEAALRSLVAGNALAVRPYSTLAQDIPREAHLVRGKHRQVVTAPSTMSLYCMGALREELEDRLAEWQKRRPKSLRFWFWF